MSQIQPLEDYHSEDEERWVSKRKDKEMMELFLVRSVHKAVHQVIEKTIVPLISSIVKQEFELAREKFLTSSKQNSGSGTHSSQTRSLQLKFLDEPCGPIFTGMQIKGKGGNPIRVALVDGITDQFVKSGPEASAKVEIVVVEGDFDSDKRSNWMPEEFSRKIVKEMEGRKSPLSGGHVYVQLNEGIGLVGAISFTHNANWMKTCKYKLGAKLDNNLSGNRVREAITESFVVKDQRNKWNEKHFPPSQCDEVWRLVKIRRGHPFHKTLGRVNIETVKDFLTQYNINPQRLREILGKGMNTKMWEAIVAHAQTCILDKKLQLYIPFSCQKEGVVFNIVGQVMGLISECCYIPIDKLSAAEKDDAIKLVVSALQHMGEVRSFDDEASMRDYLQALNASHPSNSPGLAISGDDNFEPFHTDEGQPSTPSHANVFSLLSSNAAYPSNSPRLSISGDNYVEPSHIDGQPRNSFHANIVSLDDDGSLMPASMPSYDAPYPLNSPMLGKPNSFSFEIPSFNGGYVQGSASNMGVSSLISFGSGSLSDYDFHGFEIGDLINNQPLCFLENSNCAEDGHLQVFDTDHQNSILESHGEQRSKEAAAAAAQRSWTMLFSVVRWKMKIAACKSVSSQRIHAPKRPRIY